MAEAPFPGVEARVRGSHYAILDSGAHVLYWAPPSRPDVLWVSPLASFEPGVPVRGGVPVVFPWFGAGPDGDRTPPHGFVRTAAWQRTEVVDELATSDKLLVRHTLDQTGLDSAPFQAELSAAFSAERLRIELTVVNSGDAELAFEEALHTYLSVSDVARIELDGLDGCTYLDRAQGAAAGADGDPVQAGPIRFAGEVDRIYRHTGEVVLRDDSWGRRTRVTKEGSADTVIWNPGAVRGASMADIGSAYWSGFVCVEACNVRGNAVRLAPGERHTLAQQIEPF